MHAHQIFSGVVAVLLASQVLAAPLQDKQAKEKKDAPVEAAALAQNVDNQEVQLEKLVSLAGQQSKDNNVVVHESHVSHYENKNGKQLKIEQKEQKVTDINTGKVLADVKQEVTDGTGADTITKTEVDIPDSGIHEVFVKDQVPEEGSEPRQRNVGFSPTAVAEYLMKTQEFDNFEAALKDLVSSLIMTEEEAAQYEEQVLNEYQRMVEEQEAMSRIFVDDGPMQGYYPGYAEPDKRSSMDAFADQIPQELYGLEPAYENYAGSDLVLGKQEDDSLAGIIDALLNAWWEQDLEGGNPRAQALVSYLYDVVSRDANPDDIGQIRDILADMLANALLEDVQNAETDYKREKALVAASREEESEESSEEEVPRETMSEDVHDSAEEELAKLSKETETEATKEQEVPLEQEQKAEASPKVNDKVVGVEDKN